MIIQQANMFPAISPSTGDAKRIRTALRSCARRSERPRPLASRSYWCTATATTSGSTSRSCGWERGAYPRSGILRGSKPSERQSSLDSRHGRHRRSRGVHVPPAHRGAEPDHGPLAPHPPHGPPNATPAPLRLGRFPLFFDSLPNACPPGLSLMTSCRLLAASLALLLVPLSSATAQFSGGFL